MTPGCQSDETCMTNGLTHGPPETDGADNKPTESAGQQDQPTWNAPSPAVLGPMANHWLDLDLIGD